MSDLKKSFSEVAFEKELDAVQDDGKVRFEATSLIKGIKGAKSIADFQPNDEEMALIQMDAKLPQSKEEWIVFRDVYPMGEGQVMDRQGDLIERSAEKDWAAGAPRTPILTDHNHELGKEPPVGCCLSAKVTSKGVKETWAIPVDEYNAGIIKGLMRGTIKYVSIGGMVLPEHKICNSCVANNKVERSIYDWECPHRPMRKDEKGNVTTVSIKHFDAVLERSLVNCPARLGTSIGKSVAELDEEIKSVINIENDLSGANYNSTVFVKGGLISNLLTDLSIMSVNEARQTIMGLPPLSNKNADILNSNTAATIPNVNNSTEENTLADQENKDAVIAETEDKSVEAPAAPENKEQAPADPTNKTVEMQVSLSQESVDTIKSLTETAKEQTEKFDKALTAITELKAAQDKQNELMSQVLELVKANAETVKKALEVNTPDILNELVNAVKGASAIQKEVEQPKADPNDWLPQLFQH